MTFKKVLIYDSVLREMCTSPPEDVIPFSLHYYHQANGRTGIAQRRYTIVNTYKRTPQPDKASSLRNEKPVKQAGGFEWKTII